MTDFLKDLLKVSGNEYASLASDGIISADITSYIDTGSYMLNALVSGSINKGIPSPKITVLAGESTTGKTFFLISVLANFLVQNPEGVIVLFETEGGISKEMLEDRGVETDRILVMPVSTIEEFRLQSLKLLNKYLDDKSKVPMLFCLDSYGMLSTTKETSDTADVAKMDTKDMTRAQLTKATFRVLTLKLATAGISLLVTNHTYDSMGMFSKKIMSGGQGIHLGASSVIFLSKKKEKDGTEIVGNIIHCLNYKSRATVENKKIDVSLNYTTGLNRYYGLIDLGIKYGYLKAISNKIEFPNGEKAFSKAIYKNPEKWFTQDVLDELDKLAGREYLYGQPKEEDETIPSIN